MVLSLTRGEGAAHGKKGVSLSLQHDESNAAAQFNLADLDPLSPLHRVWPKNLAPVDTALMSQLLIYFFALRPSRPAHRTGTATSQQLVQMVLVPRWRLGRKNETTRFSMSLTKLSRPHVLRNCVLSHCKISDRDQDQQKHDAGAGTATATRTSKDEAKSFVAVRSRCERECGAKEIQSFIVRGSRQQEAKSSVRTKRHRS